MKHFIRHYWKEVAKHIRQRYLLFIVLSVGMPLILFLMDLIFGLFGIFPCESCIALLSFVHGFKMFLFIIGGLGILYGFAAILATHFTMQRQKYDRGVIEVALIINGILMFVVGLVLQNLTFANDKNIALFKKKNAAMASKLLEIKKLEKNYYSKYGMYSSDLNMVDSEYKKSFTDHVSIFDPSRKTYDFFFGFNENIPEKYRSLCKDCTVLGNTFKAIAVRETSNQYIFYTLDQDRKWSKQSCKKD